MSSAHLVTGEAVVLDVSPAKLATRTLSALTDIAVQAVALVLLLLLVDRYAPDSGTRAAGGVLAIVVALIVLPTTVETLTRGRSLGRLMMGLRVVRDDGGPIRFRHALVRALLGLVEFWLTSGVVAVLVSMFHSQGKRVGDILAGTVVIRERTPRAITVPLIAMPPALARWAATADVDRVPPELVLAARQLLGRMRTLQPASGHGFATDLARQVWPFLQPPPPPGTPADSLLAAVVAERRRREDWRLTQRRSAPSAPILVAPVQPQSSPTPPSSTPDTSSSGPGFRPPT